jgi:hypothetical protein
MHTSSVWWSTFRRSVLASLLLPALLLPMVQAKPAQASQTALSASTSSSALSYAKTLKPKVWVSHDGYTRAQFSSGWGNISVQGRSCDLRNYILMRDLKNITRKATDWCLVATGTLNDPYTGKVIKFVRGVGTSLAVQIDHVVALSNAWVTGAQSITDTARFQLANDPLNLLAVDGPTNGSKSDSDAANFLPRKSYQCKYVARQLSVKRKYHLWVTASEKSSMVRVLTTCPTQKLP